MNQRPSGLPVISGEYFGLTRACAVGGFSSASSPYAGWKRKWSCGSAVANDRRVYTVIACGGARAPAWKALGRRRARGSPSAAGGV